MKLQETMLNTLPKNGSKLNGYSHDEIGDNHLFANLDTPMKADAFKMSDEEKKYFIIFNSI